MLFLFEKEKVPCTSVEIKNYKIFSFLDFSPSPSSLPLMKVFLTTLNLHPTHTKKSLLKLSKWWGLRKGRGGKMKRVACKKEMGEEGRGVSHSHVPSSQTPLPACIPTSQVGVMIRVSTRS